MIEYAIALVVAGIVLAVLSLLGLEGTRVLEAATASLALGLIFIAADRRPSKTT